MTLALYTPLFVTNAAWPYCRQRRQTEPGPQNKIVGKVLADHQGQRSFFVTRRREREPYTTLQIQHASKGCQGIPSPRVLFRTKSNTYIAAVISWDTGELRELAAFPTRRLAQAEAARLHSIL